MTRKVVFLDLDGVANSASYFRAANVAAMDRTDPAGMLDPEACALLSVLSSRTGADFVISSSWRLGWTLAQIMDCLKRRGFTGRVVGRTCDPFWVGRAGRNYSERGEEIRLDDNAPSARFVILDDDSDMGALAPYHVKTEWIEGLQREHVERAVAMLNGEAEARESRRLEVVGG